MYKAYADAAYYTDTYQGTVIPKEQLDKALKIASRHIDILTFNRIVGKDITILTEYQQEIIKECCCEIAEFEYENEDMIKNILKSYSINGVSMTFDDSWNVHIQDGVAIQMDTFSKLKTTGLTCLSMRRW